MTRGRAYLWAVNVIGVTVVMGSTFQLLWSSRDIGYLLLAALALLSGATVLRLPFVSASFSVGDAFSFAALFLYGVEAATLTVALDALAISLRLKGSLERVVFNVAAPCLAMWCAGVAVFGVADFPLPVHAPDFITAILATAAAVAIMYVVGSWLIAAAVALHGSSTVHQVWRQHFAQLWVNPVACGYVGVLMAVGVQRFGVTALTAIVPIPVILYFGFRAALGRLDDHVRHLGEMNRMHQSTIEAFATAVDAKDQVTHGHIRRVQTYCLALAKDLKADDEATLKALEAAALLHDVGKIGIPEHILNKPGPLTPAEFEIMKRHVTIGADILSGVEFPFPVIPIVMGHHENWDGSGYPHGIGGEEIPLAARILSVVDCFDALTSDRPYRPAMSVEDAFDVLRARRGNVYDPAIVDRFIALQPRLGAASQSLEPEHVVRVPRPPPQFVGDVRAASRVAQNLVEILAAALPGNLCVAYEIDDASESVVASATAGPGAAEAMGHRIDLDHGVSGWVASHRSRIGETDASLDFPGIRSGTPGALQRCSSVALPLQPPLIITIYGAAEHANARLRLSERLAELVDHLLNAAQKTSKSEH